MDSPDMSKAPINKAETANTISQDSIATDIEGQTLSMPTGVVRPQ